jgi:two-component sensor histidine kinase
MSNRRPVRVVRLNLLVAAAYFATGWLGLQLPYYSEYVTLIWVPTAIALSAIVLAGAAVAPGVFLGSFCLNVSIEPALVGGAALVALGNTLGPLLGGIVLVRRYRFRPQLDRLSDAFAFLGVGVLATGAVTATLGTGLLCAFERAPWRDYPFVWLTWIGGEAAGSLIVAPILLTWLSTPDPAVAKRPGSLETGAMVLAVAIFSASVLAYGDQLVALTYLVGLLMVWILLRAGLGAASLAVAVSMSALVAGTALGFGPFIGRSPRAELLSLWLTLASLGTANVIAGALLAERERALHLQERLLGELDHRVKNTLATVVALAERSSEDAVDVDDFRARFIGRVRAIARTHEGLARSKWQSMPVRDVVDMTLAPFSGADSDKLLAAGDDAALSAAKVAPLTMVLHELATNAAKHGAWSRNGGRVAVTWTRGEDEGLRLTWRESGGPAPPAVPAPGYGLRLIEGLVDHQLGGRVDLEFRPDGLACNLDIPPRRKPSADR